ncbi:unnamed protein product [Calypogeia fissa]
MFQLSYMELHTKRVGHWVVFDEVLDTSAQMIRENGGEEACLRFKPWHYCTEMSASKLAAILLNVEITNPTMVQNMVAGLVQAQGVEVRPGYLTGHGKEDILEFALRRLLSTISSREALAPNPDVRSSR